MNNSLKHRAEQGSRSHPRLLDHQDRRDDARRDRRRHRHHDAQLGLSHRHRDLPVAADRARRRADRGASDSIPSSIGRRSSPRPRSAPRWPISPTARSASAIPAARRCCCLPAAGARPLVLVAGHDLGQHRDHAEGRGFLLGRDHFLADARHRARRLDGRYRRARLRRRRAGLRRRSRGDRRALFLDERLARAAVLGGVHPDAAARRDGRRFSRQAGRSRWACAEPPTSYSGHREHLFSCVCCCFRSARDDIRDACRSLRKVVGCLFLTSPLM